jgi:hypothetical protein
VVINVFNVDVARASSVSEGITVNTLASDVRRCDHPSPVGFGVGEMQREVLALRKLLKIALRPRSFLPLQSLSFYNRSLFAQVPAVRSGDERDTPAVSLPQLTLSVRLCDYADCRKPLHTVLQCAKCKAVAYCSKDCQVCSPQHPACALSRPLAQETGKCTSAHHGAYTRTLFFSLLPNSSFATHRLVKRTKKHECD